MIDIPEIFADIIGLTVDQATPLVAARGISRIRVMWEDGEALLGTCDYDITRLNVSTDDGLISSVADRG